MNERTAPVLSSLKMGQASTPCSRVTEVAEVQRHASGRDRRGASTKEITTTGTYRIWERLVMIATVISYFITSEAGCRFTRPPKIRAPFPAG